MPFFTKIIGQIGGGGKALHHGLGAHVFGFTVTPRIMSA
jgi:hypothetical protein